MALETRVTQSDVTLLYDGLETRVTQDNVTLLFDGLSTRVTQMNVTVLGYLSLGRRFLGVSQGKSMVATRRPSLKMEM